MEDGKRTISLDGNSFCLGNRSKAISVYLAGMSPGTSSGETRSGLVTNLIAQLPLVGSGRVQDMLVISMSPIEA